MQVDVEIGQDQPLADPLPDDPGHLVAVELDDRVLHLDLGHVVLPVSGFGGRRRALGSRAAIGNRRALPARCRLLLRDGAMTALEKPDSHLTTVKWRFPSVHPEGRKFARDRRLRWRCSSSAARLGYLRLAAGRPDDLGRGLLPRPDPDHAARREADRRPRRRAGDDDQPRCRRRASWPGEGGLSRRVYPRLDFHERVRRPHQSLADRRDGSAHRLCPGQVPQRRPRQGERGQ